MSGPLVVAEGMADARMFDVVRVSEADDCSIEMRGIWHPFRSMKPPAWVREPVESTGEPQARNWVRAYRIDI